MAAERTEPFRRRYYLSGVQSLLCFSDVMKMVGPIVIAVCSYIVISNLISHYWESVAKAKIQKEIQLKLYEKAVCMDIVKYNDAEFYNDFVWAMQKAPTHILAATETFTDMCSTIAVTVVAGVFVISTEGLSLIVVALILGISLVLQSIGNKLRMSREEELMPLARKRDYINRVYYLINYVKDLKMSKMSENLIYEGEFLTYLFYQALVRNCYGIGVLMAIFNSSKRIKNELNKLTKLLPIFEEHSLYIDKLRTFLETENSMENGEKIALVGYNGAGKSTLTKLLLRLYDPDEGNVFYAGANIKEYDKNSYHKHFGTLFQDFEIYATDIEHNLSMGDEKLNVTLANEALEKSGFIDRFRKMHSGFETQLTREFAEDGISLSGGEAQKLALARVLYADRAVIILDEPSSALDPLAEYQLNKAITELSSDKTVIIISHRLSTTRFVDKIYMLENGKIIENGTHEELIARGGSYAEMFRVQAEQYR